MDKYATWLACGAVAAAAAGAGRSADAALGTPPKFAAVGALAGGVYLIGTFAHNYPLFGRTVRPSRRSDEFALTFDDGPDPRYTPRISRYLARRGHRATFFVLGEAAAAYPEIVAQIAADGHEIASHGYDHRLLAFSRPPSIRAQLQATERAVEQAIGHLPAPLLRAPHGVRSPWLAATVRASGYRLCGWRGRVFDTSRPGTRAIVERVTNTLAPGAVVLLHDGDGSGRGGSRDQTIEALPAIVDAAEARGLRSERVSSLMEPMAADA